MTRLCHGTSIPLPERARSASALIAKQVSRLALTLDVSSGISGPPPTFPRQSRGSPTPDQVLGRLSLFQGLSGGCTSR
jgi:hypothetical protein